MEKAKRERAKKAEQQARAQEIHEDLLPIMDIMEAEFVAGIDGKMQINPSKLGGLKQSEVPRVLGWLQLARARGWQPLPRPSSGLARAFSAPDPVHQAIVDMLVKERKDKEEADRRETEDLERKRAELNRKIAEGEAISAKLRRQVVVLGEVQEDTKKEIEQSRMQGEPPLGTTVGEWKTLPSGAMIRYSTSKRKKGDGFEYAVKGEIDDSAWHEGARRRGLEALEGKPGILDDPQVVDLIESLRRELAEKDKLIEAANRTLEKK